MKINAVDNVSKKRECTKKEVSYTSTTKLSTIGTGRTSKAYKRKKPTTSSCEVGFEVAFENWLKKQRKSTSSSSTTTTTSSSGS